MGEGSEREQCCLLGSRPTFSHFPPLPTSELGPSDADSWVGGFVYVLGPHGSLQQTLLWDWEFLMPPQPPQVFIAACPLLPHLPISAPPTSLDECFFFNPLVVRLPYSLIFWLLLVFKLFVVLFWLCKKVKCIYLCLHLGWKLSPWIKYADCHEQRLLSHHIDLRYIEFESKCILNISPLLTK